LTIAHFSPFELNIQIPTRLLEPLNLYAAFLISDWSKSGSASGSFAMQKGKGNGRQVTPLSIQIYFFSSISVTCNNRIPMICFNNLHSLILKGNLKEIRKAENRCDK